MQSQLRVITPDDRFVPAPVASTSIVVMTAIDGVLRHPRTGSYHEARVALDLLAQQSVPTVLLSHGGAESVQDLQRELRLVEPFVCHGGATLFIPRGYFEELDGLTSGDDAWEVFEFGVRDPARAVRLLTSLYAVRGEDILTIGFGADWVDRALLAAVDVPIVVRNPDVDQSRLLRRFPGAYLTQASGPDGWSEAVLGSAAI
jgi:predicted mannosyl-3-phosphoglycerate phosphatase (HAD superfamily)